MEPFIGEIRMWGANFAPVGWAFCDGSLLPIAEYDAVFNLLGATFGGDGMETFGLPDLRGRVPIGAGGGYQIGQAGGAEAVALTPAQLPVHKHDLMAVTDLANQANPSGTALAKTAGVQPYGAGAPSLAFAPAAIQAQGGGSVSPHDNLQPYLVFGFIIALEGIYPPQS